MRSSKEATIAKTLEITTDFAFKFLRNGKYRRAANMAQDTLRQLPPQIRKSADASMLRMIGSSARYIADWYAADTRERERKTKRRWKSKQTGSVVSIASTAHLLLVPEPPAESDKL